VKNSDRGYRKTNKSIPAKVRYRPGKYWPVFHGTDIPAVRGYCTVLSVAVIAIALIVGIGKQTSAFQRRKRGAPGRYRSVLHGTISCGDRYRSAVENSDHGENRYVAIAAGQYRKVPTRTVVVVFKH